MVKTNVPSKPDSTVARWTAQGLEVSRNGFTDNIIQEKAASGAYATTPALVGGGGAFEFTCPTSHPTFDVGFGSIGGSTCKYGFRFTNAGVVYPIINGAVSNSYIATDVDGTDISIRKEGKTSICVLTEQEVRQEPYPFRMQLTQTQMWALSERTEQSPP